MAFVSIPRRCAMNVAARTRFRAVGPTILILASEMKTRKKSPGIQARLRAQAKAELCPNALSAQLLDTSRPPRSAAPFNGGHLTRSFYENRHYRSDINCQKPFLVPLTFRAHPALSRKTLRVSAHLPSLSLNDRRGTALDKRVVTKSRAAVRSMR